MLKLPRGGYPAFPGKSEGPMTIRRQLRWLALIGICGLLIFAAVTFTALLQIEVNGPLYRTISLSSDLIADYVPPSESLLEPALACAKLIEAPDQESRRRYEENIKAFQREYDRRYADYMLRVPEGKLRAMIRGEAYETAQEYFRLADQLIALVNQGRGDEARTLLVSTMNPLYELHAAAVDQIVILANKQARTTESLASKSVRFFTAAMVVIGLHVLIAVGALSWVIARGIAAQTDRLIVSEESRSQQAQLLQSVISSMAEGLVTVNGRGDIQVWNREAERLLGPSPLKYDNSWAASLGIYLADGITLCPPECSPLFQAIGGQEAHAELLLKNPRHKTSLWLEVNARPVRDASGATTGGLAVLRDTTERFEMVAALEQAKNELEQRVERRTAELVAAKESAESADRLKSAFLATMSHELRTPLNSIIGFTGIILQGLAGPVNAEQKKQLGMVQASSRHLLELITDVLDISKIEAGQLALRSASFNARQSVEKVVRSVQPQAEAKGLQLRSALEPSVATVTGDHRRVEQVLLNLLSNAIKFTDVGEVSINCAVKDGYFAARVRDTGIGIAASDLVHLFRPFRQVDTGLARKYEGSGLGLSICRRLAEMMGGSISVESVPDRGSTFTFRFPVGGPT